MLFAGLGFVCSATSCAGSADQAETTSSASEPIINGSTQSTDYMGTPRLSNAANGAGCSSTLLNDHWLITAKHCVTVSGQIDNGAVARGDQMTAATNTGVTAIGRNVFRNLDHDVALIQLASPLPPPSGASASWTRPLYTGSSSSLVGNSYFCQGWGDNKCDNTGFGTLRSAFIKVSATSGDGFTMVPNGAGQIQWHGDSGGSCYVTAGGQWYILGTVSTGNCGSDVHMVGADAVRDWVAQTMSQAIDYTVYRPINGDSRGYTGDGDWSWGYWKGECNGTITSKAFRRISVQAW